MTTIEDILEAKRRLQQTSPILSGMGFNPYGSVPIFDSPTMTQTEIYEEEEPLTRRQRWIEPLLHPVTMPFEPWVKTRTVTKTRQVPSHNVLQTSFGLFMHPAIRSELMSVINNMTA